jgi:hypothetical protein
MSAKKPQASRETVMSLLFSDMILRGVEGVDEMDEHKDSWLPLPPGKGVEATSCDDAENNDFESGTDESAVELPSRVTRLE